MVVIVDTSNHPGSQPLPRLDNFLLAVLSMFMPPPPDVAAKRFDPSKMKEIKEGFKPKPMDDGGGCMLTAYNVLDTLYGSGFGERLKNEVNKHAYEKVQDQIKANPALFKKQVEEAMAADSRLTRADAVQQVKDNWASPHITSDHTYTLMGEKGLAGEKVHTANKDADDVIRRLTPPEPGTYVFGMAVRGHHTVTLVVETAANGTQTMHWLDQYSTYDSKQDRFETKRTGDSREIKEGKLGDALSNWVFNGPDTTNIYALRPPAGKAP